MITIDWTSIAACAALTVAVRAMPIMLLSSVEMPAFVQRWLSFVPAAIMSALVVSELIARPAWSPAGYSVSILAAFISLGTGLLTRGLFAIVLAGVAAFLILQALLP